MKLHIICDPYAIGCSWVSRTLEVILREARKKCTPIVVSPIELSEERLGGIFSECEGRLIIVVGNTISWINSTIERLGRYNFRIILVDCSAQFYSYNVNIVQTDHRLATRMLVDYLSSRGCRRLALYAVNSNAYSDEVKRAAFSESGSGLVRSDIYYNNGSLCDCFSQFERNIPEYDGVICANDVAAVHLLKNAEALGVRVPEQLSIVSFGGTTIARMVSPSITTIRLRSQELGNQAVELFFFLLKKPENVSVRVSVACDIVEGETTSPEPLPSGTADRSPGRSESEVIFTDDAVVNSMMQVELSLRYCDELDLEIIRCILRDERYYIICDKLFLSESSLKYRIRQLQSKFGCTSRPELIEKLRRYL